MRNPSSVSSSTRPRPEPVPDTDVDVVIAGAGPVGLLLANLLGKQGRRVMVIERRTKAPPGSMAIGITPPSLTLLQDLDLDEEFIRRGLPIDTARVFENGAGLGAVDFSRLPTHHRFILSLPQSITANILRDNLDRFPSVRLVEGVEVVNQEETPGAIRVRVRDRLSGARSEVSAVYLVGCDGCRSGVRRSAGIRCRRRQYRSRFLMADFDDDTVLGREAHLYFGRDGSVESFPLPGGRRRWIVLEGCASGDSESVAKRVAHLVRHRTGYDLTRTRAHFASAFQPERILAGAYVRGRVVLCGDAAHVMSPIGGQGMNTGFADAAHLARVLSHAIDNPKNAAPEFIAYAQSRRRAFRIAAGRAARGMWLGTRTGPVFSAWRRFLIARILLRPAVREKLAPYFAMLTIPGDSTAADHALAGGGEQ